MRSPRDSRLTFHRSDCSARQVDAPTVLSFTHLSKRTVAPPHPCAGHTSPPANKSLLPSQIDFRSLSIHPLRDSLGHYHHELSNGHPYHPRLTLIPPSGRHECVQHLALYCRRSRVSLVGRRVSQGDADVCCAVGPGGRNDYLFGCTAS